MNENLLLAYIDKILIEKNVQNPFEGNENAMATLDGTEKIEFDPFQIPGFMSKLFELQKNNRVLIVTEQEIIKNLVQPLNASAFTEKFPAVCYNRELYATEALKEVERLDNILVDESGNEYIIQGEIVALSNMYSTDEGCIVLKDADCRNTDLVKLSHQRRGTCWGALLPSDKYSLASFNGRIDNLNVDLNTAFTILKDLTDDILKNNGNRDIPYIENIFVFNKKHCLITRWGDSSFTDTDSFLRSLAFSILFKKNYSRHDESEVLGIILDYAAGKNIPVYILDFFEKVFYNKEDVSAHKWSNVLSCFIQEN